MYDILYIKIINRFTNKWAVLYRHDNVSLKVIYKSNL